MRAVIQRVSSAKVLVEQETAGSIGQGLLVLLGVHHDDEKTDADYLAEKISNLRIFDDPKGKMNISIKDSGGEVLVISQFTLLGECRKGRRPSYSKAAQPEQAVELYWYFIQDLIQMGLRVQKGRFQSTMSLELVNEGPVTLILDSKQGC